MALEVRAREDQLRQQLRELRIEIDEQRQARKVAEITGTEYFKDLRDRARESARSSKTRFGLAVGNASRTSASPWSQPHP